MPLITPSQPCLATFQNDNHVSVSWCVFSFGCSKNDLPSTNHTEFIWFWNRTRRLPMLGGGEVRRRRKSASSFRDLPQIELSLSSSVCLGWCVFVCVCVRASMHQIFIYWNLCHTSLKRSTAFVNSIGVAPCHISHFILIFSMIIRRCLFFLLSKMLNPLFLSPQKYHPKINLILSHALRRRRRRRSTADINVHSRVTSTSMIMASISKMMVMNSYKIH